MAFDLKTQNMKKKKNKKKIKNKQTKKNKTKQNKNKTKKNCHPQEPKKMFFFLGTFFYLLFRQRLSPLHKNSSISSLEKTIINPFYGQTKHPTQTRSPQTPNQKTQNQTLNPTPKPYYLRTLRFTPIRKLQRKNTSLNIAGLI